MKSFNDVAKGINCSNNTNAFIMTDNNTKCEVYHSLQDEKYLKTFALHSRELNKTLCRLESQRLLNYFPRYFCYTSNESFYV